MIILPSSAGPQEMFGFCLGWIDSLVAEHYERASAMLYRTGEEWSAEDIRTAIETYGSFDAGEGGVHKVTPYVDAVGENPRQDPILDIPHLRYEVHPQWPIVITLMDADLATTSGAGLIELTYALNGSWSDLRSSFVIHGLEEGIAFELERIDTA